MNDSVFPYDVFLSHSAKDEAVVWPLAERLRARRAVAGRRRRMFCMSAQAFGSDWAQLLNDPQPSTLNPQPTGAPLNRERRFISLWFDDAPIKGSLAQFLHINWRPKAVAGASMAARTKTGPKRKRRTPGKD